MYTFVDVSTYTVRSCCMETSLFFYTCVLSFAPFHFMVDCWMCWIDISGCLLENWNEKGCHLLATDLPLHLQLSRKKERKQNFSRGTSSLFLLLFLPHFSIFRMLLTQKDAIYMLGCHLNQNTCYLLVLEVLLASRHPVQHIRLIERAFKLQIGLFVQR